MILTIKKHYVLTLLLIGVVIVARAQQETKPEDTEVWDPEPKVITAGNLMKAPSDALVLFDGTDLNQWESLKSSPALWTNTDQIMTVTAGSGDIRTKEKYTNFQLHIEWRTPSQVVGDGQGRGNSGIFLQGLYEVQVLDSYANRTYANGQAGSIYKQSMPLVNPTRPPGTWQEYDIIYTAPVFDASGVLSSKARVTVLLNGVLVQNNTEIQGPTVYNGQPVYAAHGPGPIQLQDHGNPTSFRNIWIRKL